MAVRDPGAYDMEEFATSVLRARLDVDLLAARAFTGDVSAMCMYAEWLAHRATVDDEVDHPERFELEARAWLERAMSLGSWRAAALLGARPAPLRLASAGTGGERWSTEHEPASQAKR